MWVLSVCMESHIYCKEGVSLRPRWPRKNLAILTEIFHNNQLLFFVKNNCQLYEEHKSKILLLLLEIILLLSKLYVTCDCLPVYEGGWGINVTCDCLPVYEGGWGINETRDCLPVYEGGWGINETRDCLPVYGGGWGINETRDCLPVYGGGWGMWVTLAARLLRSGKTSRYVCSLVFRSIQASQSFSLLGSARHSSQ